MRANRYVSYLGTEIEPNAMSTLARFERATEKAFDKIGAFNTRGASRLGVGIGAGFDRSTKSINTATSSLDRLQTSATRTAPAVSKVAHETNVMSTAFIRSAQALNVVQGPLGPLAGRLSALGVIFRDLAGISLAGVLGGGGAFAIGSIASSYQMVTDRLRPFYDTQVQTNAAMRDVIRIARLTRQELDPVAQLYSRLAQAGKDANVNVPTARLAETVAKAARLSGGSQETQSAGIGQFIQGYGSGTLSGEELKSIRENTFRLAKAIADGLDVPIAKLKELGAEGKLTPQIVAAALARSADQIDAEFQRLTIRPGQAITQAANNLAIFLGQMDQATGATQGFAKAIMLLGDNIPAATTAMVGLATVFAARNLAGPIADATTKLERFISVNRMMSQARRGAAVTPLTPTGIERAKAASAVEAAAIEQRAADARVRAERSALFMTEQRLAAGREALALTNNELRTLETAGSQSVIMANARVSAAQRELQLAQEAAVVRRAADVEAARQAVSAARAAQQQARLAEAAASQRLIAANQAAAGPATGSRADQRRAAATAARAQAVAEAELAAAQEVSAAATAKLTAAQAALTGARAAAITPTTAVAAATTELAAAESALAAATVAETEARAANSAAAAVSAQRGWALLGLAEQRILAEQRLATATAASTAATNAMAGATTRLAAAQTAFGAASALGARAMAGLSRAGSALAGMLGGPVGIALTAVTVGMTYLATRTDEAMAAFDRFKSSQDGLISKLAQTADALRNVSAEARQAVADIALVGVQKAKQTRQDAASSLADKLDAAVNQSRPFGTNLFGNDPDTKRINQVIENLRSGRDSGITYKDLSDIVKRNPKLFQRSSTLGSLGMNGLLGNRPNDTLSAALGYVQTTRELQDAERLRNNATQPRPRAPAPDFNGPQYRTPEQLAAEAGDVATGGTRLAQARKAFAKEKADLDAELARRRKAGDYSFDDEYVTKLAAAQSTLNAVGDAQRGAASGARAHNKAIREQTAELKLAESNANKLSQITSRYQDEPSAVRRGQMDQEAIDNLFVSIKDGKAEILDVIQILNNETGKLEPFTREDAQRVKDNIESGVRKPIRDAIRDQERELEISKMILSGRADEADLLQQKYSLIDRVGDITEGELATLRMNAAEQQRINRAIEQRSRLVDIQARAYGDMQESLKELYQNGAQIAGGLIGGASGALGALFGGRNIGRGAAAGAGDNLKGIKDFAEGLMSSFSRAVAEKWSLEMFGDKEQEMRDALTRAIDTSASNLTTSADNLNTSATMLGEAARLVAMGSGGAAAGIAGGGDWTSDVKDTIEHLGDAFGDEITVTGERLRKAVQPSAKSDPARMGIEQRFNQIGKDFSSKIFGAKSPLTQAASKLGTFLSGAQYAPVGVGISQMFGSKGSSLGAAIGGGLGKTLLGGSNGLLAKGLSSISSSLGSFAGPLGSVLGSVAGSLIGGLFKPAAKYGSSTLTGGGAFTTTGNASSAKKTASGLGGSVQSGVNRIAEALGGSVGAYDVMIGTYDGKYRVRDSAGGYDGGKMDFKGKSAIGLHDFGEDQAGAIQYAIMNAIQDGAVKGIREGARRLLMAGNDLDSALQNALDFQNVFRELKQYTDPVGAAIDDLNVQFDHLIDLFNQAGASTAEFQDLQKLYDLKRADAIKQASDGAVDNLQSFIDNLKGSADSPLGRRTAYNNARSSVDAFRADLASGKVVDTDKLLDALGNLQDTSRNLNGSRSAFYSDFADIIALAEQAKGNINATNSAGGALPASPFDDPEVKAKLGQTADNTAQLITEVRDGLSNVADAIDNLGSYGGSVNGSSFDYLPTALSNRSKLYGSGY